MSKRLDDCNIFIDGTPAAYNDPRPPRRLPSAEAALWDKFRASHPDYFEVVYYDVIIPRHELGHVKQRQQGETLQQACQRGWNHNTALRADVIGIFEGTAQIVEVHLSPREDCLGRVQRYNQLAKEWWPQYRWLMPLVISQDDLADQLFAISYPAIEFWPTAPDPG